MSRADDLRAAIAKGQAAVGRIDQVPDGKKTPKQWRALAIDQRSLVRNVLELNTIVDVPTPAPTPPTPVPTTRLAPPLDTGSHAPSEVVYGAWARAWSLAVLGPGTHSAADLIGAATEPGELAAICASGLVSNPIEGEGLSADWSLFTAVISEQDPFGGLDYYAYLRGQRVAEALGVGTDFDTLAFGQANGIEYPV